MDFNSIEPMFWGRNKNEEREVGSIFDYSYCPLFYFRSATSPLKTIRRKK
jgi:hypothetical protein